MTLVNQIIFDLDGTISDPLVGVANSLNYALNHFGYQPLSTAEVTKYIGPPLDLTFKEITSNEALVPALIAKYRDRYAEIGYSENVLYPGIKELIYELNAANIPMVVCTTKPQHFARQILEMFGIGGYFQCVSGGEIGISKTQQIESLLKLGMASDSIMVGDRATDIIAARENGLKAGGVLWGYGSRNELAHEAPLYLFGSPKELLVLKGDRSIC